MGVTNYVRGQSTLNAIDAYFEASELVGKTPRLSIEDQAFAERNARIIFAVLEAAEPQSAPDPAEHDEGYSSGYDAGWHAAKRGHPAKPSKNEPNYIQGYQHGFQMASHAAQVTSQPGSDQSQKSAGALLGHHMSHLQRATHGAARRAGSAEIP